VSDSYPLSLQLEADKAKPPPGKHRLRKKLWPGARKTRVLQRYLIWPLQGLLLALFSRICAILPPERAAAAGGRMAALVGPRLSKSRRVRRNVALAFPEKTWPEIDQIVTGVWRNFGQVLAEYAHLDSISARAGNGRVEVVIKGDDPAWAKSDKPKLFVTAHLANWELAASSVVSLGIPLSVIYSPQNNPWVDRLIQKLRQPLGCGFLAKEDSIRSIMGALKTGRSIGMLVDQRVDSGENVPFFGLDAQTTTTPARLALKYGYELVPIRIERLQVARYRATFYEPVEPPDPKLGRREQALEMTRQINALIETWVRERPEQCSFTKRRWAREIKPVQRLGGGK